jgi:hypothetical protein
VRRLLAAAALAALAACGSQAPENAPVAEETEVPAELQAEAPTEVQTSDVEATPLAERVATLGLINKRNNISRDIEIKPGEARRIDDVVIRLASCERTAPWEEPAEIGAFVQLLVNERPDAESEAQWNRVFSGWLFKNNPGLNVVEHPIYDVWVKDCAMRFPGEDEAVKSDDSDGDAPPPRAAPRPAPSATAAPAPEPSAPTSET